MDGTRFVKVSSQPCWTIVEMTGRRPSDGKIVGSPVLLLADGRAGRYWPGPKLKDLRPGERVGGQLEPLTPDSLILRADDDFLRKVEHHLGHAVVHYERG